MLKISDKDYLKQTLKSAQLELKEIEIQHRIETAEFNIKKEMLQKQITSIELQLDERIIL